MTINRTQALVLGFCLAAWILLVGILAFAPEVYADTLRQAQADPRMVGWAFLAAISAFLVLLGVGVIRRWRWMFWLILVAFLAGLLRVPTSAFELSGLLPANGPAWYVLLQAVIGVVQFAIGLMMLFGFRRAGVWGAFGRGAHGGSDRGRSSAREWRKARR